MPLGLAKSLQEFQGECHHSADLDGDPRIVEMCTLGGWRSGRFDRILGGDFDLIGAAATVIV